LPDLEIIFEKCRQGDKLAWEALVKTTQSRIYGLAMFYVRDPAEAEDLAQEIFIRVYRSLHQVKSSAGFRPWMFRIARNCCLDRIRRIKSRPRTIGAGAIEQAPEPNQATADQSWDAKQRKDLLYRAMDRLSEQAREILLLKEIQQLKLTEIAQILSLPIGTIKSRTSRARVELAKSILALDPSYGAPGRESGISP
jgi:RNA polymerase sigma-70 factor (ECF subfamily)